MDEVIEGEIALRKASTDEIEFLKARAAKHDKMNRKKYTTWAVISVLAAIMFFVLNETMFHKPFYRILQQQSSTSNIICSLRSSTLRVCGKRSQTILLS